MTCQGLTHGLYSIALEKFADGDGIPESGLIGQAIERELLLSASVVRHCCLKCGASLR